MLVVGGVVVELTTVTVLIEDCVDDPEVDWLALSVSAVLSTGVVPVVAWLTGAVDDAAPLLGCVGPGAGWRKAGFSKRQAPRHIKNNAWLELRFKRGLRAREGSS